MSGNKEMVTSNPVPNGSHPQHLDVDGFPGAAFPAAGGFPVALDLDLAVVSVSTASIASGIATIAIGIGMNAMQIRRTGPLSNLNISPIQGIQKDPLENS